MTFDLSLILSNTLSGIIIQLPTFILIIWVTKKIVKQMPSWLRILHENNIKEIALQKAVSMSK